MEKPKKLLFLTQYDVEGASSRIYIYQFIPYFEAAGFKCDVRPLIRHGAEKTLRALASNQGIFAFLKLFTS